MCERAAAVGGGRQVAGATPVAALAERRAASLAPSWGHEAEREEAAAGRRAAPGGSSFPPQRRPVVPLPGPGVLQLAQHGRTRRHPPAAGRRSWAPVEAPPLFLF